LTSHGYIVKRDKSPLAGLWNQSPFQMTTSVKESFGPTYLNSVLRTTRIDVVLRLSRSGTEIWNTKVTAQTKVSSSRFSAFEAGYLASATKRDPDVEKRLHDDALAVAVEVLPGKLSTLPDWKAESGSRY
jgi:hypothetical protein